MTRKKTIPVPAEKVYQVAREQLATCKMHLEAVEAKLERLYAEIQAEEIRKAGLEEDITALEDFLGQDKDA